MAEVDGGEAAEVGGGEVEGVGPLGLKVELGVLQRHVEQRPLASYQIHAHVGGGAGASGVACGDDDAVGYDGILVLGETVPGKRLNLLILFRRSLET
eukprot:430058-Hanusia_phi.AAC.1